MSDNFTFRELQDVNHNVIDVDIKYHDPELTKVAELDNGDWIDLRCAEKRNSNYGQRGIYLNMGQFAIISLGVSIKVPEEYEVWLAPRSSTFKNFKVIETNGIGIIDNSYCGDNDILKMPVYAMEDTFIPFDARIAQFRLIPRMHYMMKDSSGMPMYSTIKFHEKAKLDGPDRGGLGSTGI